VVACALVAACSPSSSRTAKQTTTSQRASATTVEPAAGTLLPAPAPPPAGSPSQQAASLAQGVLSPGPGSLPALLTALQLSGIAVRDPSLANKVIVAPADPAQGLSVPAGMVRAFDHLEQAGYAAPLGSVTAVLASALPGTTLTSSQLADLLVQGIRAHANDSTPTLAFWSQFIVDLGQYGTSATNLLGKLDAGAANVDPIQILLILWRLIGDLSAQAKTAGVPFVGSAAAGQATLIADNPCNLAGINDQLYEGSHDVSSAGFEVFMDSVKEDLHGLGAVAFGLASAALGVGLGIAMFFLAHQQVTWNLDPPPPLVRTHTTQPGDQATLGLTLAINGPDSSWDSAVTECLRSIPGIELPKFGPVEGAQVQWTFADSASAQYVWYSNCANGPACQTTTGSDGSTQVTVEGRPQTSDLPANLPTVDRTAQVLVAVALKPSNLISDLASALSFLIKGGIGPKLISELLDRMASRGATYALAVRDVAHDYWLNWTSPQGVTIQGGVCDGPAGTWHLALGGLGGEVSGEITFTMDKYQRSTDLTGEESINLSAATAKVAITSGQALLTGSGSSATLAITAQGSMNGVAANIYSFGGGGLSGSLPFTVKVGNFCSTIKAEGGG